MATSKGREIARKQKSAGKSLPPWMAKKAEESETSAPGGKHKKQS